MIKIFIAGDSTASIKDAAAYPETGWGEAFRFFLRKGAELRNYAYNAKSTKSFRDEGRLARILEEAGPGDFVLIQFGHNDGKEDDPARYAAPFGAYQENLKDYIQKIRQRGATPILLTSCSRRLFGADGKLQPDTLGPYPQAMREAAEREQTEWVDMYARSTELLEAYGSEKSKDLFMHLAAGEHENYPEGKEDDTHFSPLGAYQLAKILATELLKTSAGKWICPEVTE
ncbi:hypothetical protein C3V36_08780 [Lachnospiraceae bacterium oral taxon 500]|nr:hypothetical protein C3V36_08780 [Lachnospiraceae bacterium oral taxon 500]